MGDQTHRKGKSHVRCARQRYNKKRNYALSFDRKTQLCDKKLSFGGSERHSLQAEDRLPVVAFAREIAVQRQGADIWGGVSPFQQMEQDGGMEILVDQAPGQAPCGIGHV